MLNSAKALRQLTKRKTKLTASEEKAEMSAYFYDVEKKWLSAVVASAVMGVGSKVVDGLFSFYRAIQHHAGIQADLKHLSDLDGQEADNVEMKYIFTELSELTWIALLFTSYGENLVRFINVKSIAASFIDRVDRDGTLILSRDNRGKYKEMSEGYIFRKEDFESDEDEEDDY